MEVVKKWGVFELDLATKVAYTMIVDGRACCLVIADRFLLPTEVCDRYAEHTGFARASVRCVHHGFNVLEFEK